MPFVGSIIPASILGADTKDRRVARKREVPSRAVEKGESFERALDEAELSAVESAESSEADRNAKSNDAEEAREERTGGPLYGPRHPKGHDEGHRPQLDIKG